jgi:hypothetical protein
VKAPRLWPKSSLSISVSGVAPQFCATKTCVARAESTWIALATSSLPVPVSPSTTTGSPLRATRGNTSRTAAQAGDSPSMAGIAAWSALAAD